MNTLWHLFWTYIIFRGKSYCKKTLVFAVVPDITALAILMFSLITNGADWNAFHHAFSNVFANLFPLAAFFHSFAIIAIALILMLIFHLNRLMPYIYGWTFHLFLDIFTHVSDVYPIFWPLSSYIIPNRISYWEPQYHALELNVINLILVAIAVYVMAKDNKNKSFEAKLIAFILIGTIASGLFVYNQGITSPWFMLANVVAIAAMIVYLIRFRKFLVQKRL